jgi:mRNA interferase MazF
MTERRVRCGGLYNADLNPRFGTEEGKGRPVVVVQSDLLNETGHPSTWVLPCTTRLSGESLLRIVLPKGMAGNARACEVMVDQSRTIDNARFKRRLGMLPPAILEELKQKLRCLAEL